MKTILILVLFVFGSVLAAGAETTPPTPTPQPILKVWKVSAIPWDAWFKDNAMATDKSLYVHFFLNAQDFKGNLAAKDKKRRLAETAIELVKRLYPQDAQADLVKVDIVYVLERDNYGMPKWDSLERVAHLEFLRSKILKLPPAKTGLSEAAMKKLFDKFEIF